MSDSLNMHLLEMMASKICHDLISPIGAVNNGLEILEEMGPEAGPEVTELISYSAAQASAKLRAFRLIYGAGGADSNLKPDDAHKAIDNIISADNKILQRWNTNSFQFEGEMKSGYCKILTAFLMLGTETLPKGGEIRAQGDENGFTVSASGPNAGLRDIVKRALNDDLGTELEPQAVHGAMCALIARHYGYSTEIRENGGETVEFHVSVL